jgi:hypothetical protein
MNAFFDGLPSAQFALNLRKDALLTAAYGLKLFAYEGGPGPGGSALGTIDANNEEILAYNRSPRMRERMPIAQEIWDQHGGDLLCYFHLGGGENPWGFGDPTTPTLSTTTPKALALEDMRTTPRAPLTYGFALPASITLPGNPDVLLAGNTYVPPGNPYTELRPNSSDPFLSGTVMIPLRTTASTPALIRLNYLAWSACSVDLFVGSHKVGTFNLPASSTFTDSGFIEATIPAGFSAIRLRQTGANAAAVLKVDILDRVETPVFSVPGGSYSVPQTVTITCPTESAEIRYTTNGSTPTAASTLYTGPITIESTTTLRAIAFRPGLQPSLERSATYILGGNIYAGALLGWNFTQSGLNDGSAPSAPSNYQRTGVQPSVLTRGPGLPPAILWAVRDRGTLGFLVPPSGGPNSSTLAAAKAAGSYFQFTVTPQPGYQLALSGLRVAPFQQNASPTATLTAEYSLDGFATPGLPIGNVVSMPGNWTPSIQTFDLSGITALQAVTTPVTIRLWFHGFSAWENGGIGMISGDSLDVGVLGTSSLISGYELWLQNHPTLTGNQTLPLADPDGDGMVNLLEYALGSSPENSSSGSLPVAAPSGDHLTLSFTPHKTAGLRYIIEASSDLSNWSEQTDITALLSEGQPYIHQDSANLSTNPRRFLRLRVIQQ